MKLNLNFDLYKGTTRLKQWWKEVKTHFAEVQEAHNALEDAVAAESGKLSTEITQRTNADIALSDRINAEENTRSSADASLGQRITTEAKNREKADNNLQVRIDEISQSSGTSTLFGDELMTHTVKFVAPENKPTLYWDGDQEYYGDSICVDIELTNSFYIDGKQISGAFEELCISVPCDEGIYIVVQYNFADNTCDIKTSTNAVASTISGNVWTFTLYHYYDIRLDFKVDSSSPTGSRYVFEDCNTDYIEPNEDTTGNTYTIANTYERLRTLDNLNTENKNSFLDAVNENADKINYFISLRPSDREIFVMCDGDHDELKIQAALDAVATGGVVYPYPKDGFTVVTLSNTNTTASYVRNYTSVIKIPNYITLDFKYCAGVGLKFVNSNPGTSQILFDLQSNAIMLNMPVIDFDSETVTSTSDNPTLIYTGAYARVENCDLSGYAGTNNTSMSVYGVNIGPNSRFVGNIISGTEISKLTGNMRMYNFGGYTLVENNTFATIDLPDATTGGGIEGYLFYFSSCTLIGNKFSNIDFKGRRFASVGTTALWSENDFYKITDVSFTLSGIIKYCTFRTIVGNWDDYTFSLSTKTVMTKNKFLGISQPGSDCENALFFANANDHIIISDNLMTEVSTCDNVPLFDLDYSGCTQLKDNYIYYSAPNENTKVVIANGISGCEIKNNTTNAVSMGTYDSTCIVEGNITGFGA